MVGIWINTDRGSSGGTERLEVSERDGALAIRGFGVGEPDPIDWGEVAARPLAKDTAGGEAWAFNCTFDLGFASADVAAYGKEGILIAATFVSFADESGRADYWTREFFHLSGRD